MSKTLTQLFHVPFPVTPHLNKSNFDPSTHEKSKQKMSPSIFHGLFFSPPASDQQSVMQPPLNEQ
jgi:hypothetical protein